MLLSYATCMRVNVCYKDIVRIWTSSCHSINNGRLAFKVLIENSKVSRVQLLQFLSRMLWLAVKFPASQQHYSASLSTSAGKELSSLLGFPSSSWPLASAVVRELLGGGRSQTSTSKSEATAESIPQATVGTVGTRQPNRDLAELLELDSSSPVDKEDLARRVVGPLQRICPQLEKLSPAEITALVAALGHLQVKDSLIDIALEAVRLSLTC